MQDVLTAEAFHDLVKESAARISSRQETDTIELIDDVRFYLGQQYGVFQDDINRETGQIDFKATQYEIRYNKDIELLDDLLEQLSLDG